MAELAYILAASHSGSTLLAMLLGAHPEVCSVGELKISPTALGDPRQYRCSCGQRITACTFWKHVGAAMKVRGHQFDVTNARTLPVDIEVTRGFETPQWELTPAGDGVTYEKHDVTHARFKLSVAPRSKEVFTYTVTTYHGTREEVFIRRQQEQQ